MLPEISHEHQQPHIEGTAITIPGACWYRFELIMKSPTSNCGRHSSHISEQVDANGFPDAARFALHCSAFSTLVDYAARPVSEATI